MKHSEAHPPITHYRCVLSVKRLHIPVRLGVSEEERAKPQPIEIDVRLFYPHLPEAVGDDYNTDYFCYDEMCGLIVECCTKKEYHLVEYLSQAVYSTIRPRLDARVAIWIRLHKKVAPVPHLMEGSEFIYSDMVAGASYPPLG